MKAEIDRDGELKVIPETDTEIFALRLWKKDYEKQDENAGSEDHFAVLKIHIPAWDTYGNEVSSDD